MNKRRRTPLGELLLEQGLIDGPALEAALASLLGSGRRLGAALVESGQLSEQALLDVLATQLGLPFVDVSAFEFDVDIVALIPEILARRYRALALARDESGVLVGMSDPTDLYALDALSRRIPQPLRVAIVREHDLLACIDRLYRRSGEIAGFAEQLSDELSEPGDGFHASSAEASKDAPVVRLLDSLVDDAVRRGASDLHIEPDTDVLRVRQRIDGVLYEQCIDEQRVGPVLAQRVKLLARMNIAEKRLPQDGRFSIEVDRRHIDVRAATMPVQNGEAVTLRLLDQSAGVRDIDSLGMPPPMRERFRSLVRQPHGLVVVTGPTGSGKTTTLYAGLRERNGSGEKLITVEDPVEYRLPRVNQVQVRTDIGLEFSGVLRAALRHDPDVILIGEMRDEETTSIGLRAAMTGHLVLSTLHTNDALSAIARMLDLGAPGYLLASSLRAIVAQRLVRRICPHCTTTHEPGPAEQAWLLNRFPLPSGGLRMGTGCAQCAYTGYRGRIGVYELLDVDESLTTAIAREDTVACAAAVRSRSDHVGLEQAAFELACECVTSLEEVMRLYADVAAPARASA